MKTRIMAIISLNIILYPMATTCTAVATTTTPTMAIDRRQRKKPCKKSRMARPMVQFLLGTMAGSLSYHYGLASYTLEAIVAHVKRVNHFRDHKNDINNQTNRPIRFSVSKFVHWPLPRRPRLSRPTLPFRFAAPLASPPPSMSVDVALLEAMWGTRVTEEILLWRIKKISNNCPNGKSLHVNMRANGNMGAFCAPKCQTGFELVVKSAESKDSTKVSEHVCAPIRAPPPIPPRAPPTPPLRKKKRKKKQKS